MFSLKFYNDEKFSHSVSRDAMKARVIESVKVNNVLVLSPHPDDDALGCGGLLAYLSEEGAKIRVVYFDDGARGNNSGVRDRDLIWQREEEVMKALSVLKVSEVKFLRQKNIAKDKNLWHLVLEELKTRQNDLVLSPSHHDWHPDHVALAKASTYALKKITKNKPEVWSYFVWGVPPFNLIFPINKYLKVKKQAIYCYKSQLGVKAYDEAVLAMNEYLGKALGVGKYVEGYFKENFK